MKPDAQLRLMYLVLDGEATPDEAAALERLIAIDPTAREEFDELRRLVDGLSRVPKAFPPEGLVASVMAKLPQAGIARAGAGQLFSSFGVIRLVSRQPRAIDSGKSRGIGPHLHSKAHFKGEYMSEEKNAFSGKRKVLIGAGVAAAALILVVSFGMDFPPSNKDTVGTIVPAQRYRAPQATAQDVKLGDQSGAPSTPINPVSQDALGSQAGNALSTQSGNALSTQSGSALSTQSGNALSTQSGSALSNQSANALSNQSANALSNQSANALSNQSANALSNQSANALSNQSASALSNQSANALSNQSANALSNQSGSALSNQSGSALSNQSGSALSNQSGSALSKQSGNALSNQSGSALSKQSGSALSNQSGSALSKQSGSALSTQSGSALSNQSGNALSNQSSTAQ